MSRSLDAWPALADLSLTLFLCTLGAASWYSDEAKQKDMAEKEVGLLRDQVAQLSRELQDRADCSGASPFLDRFQTCLGVLAAEATRDGCSVRIPESLVKFETGRDEPTPATDGNARKLARCLFEAEQHVIESHSDAAIQTIQIDGHTDCVGPDLENFDLAGRRALWLYGRYAERVGAVDALDRWRYLGKVATRAFGEHSPTEASLCSGRADQALGASVEADRRVTITVQLQEVVAPEAVERRP